MVGAVEEPDSGASFQLKAHTKPKPNTNTTHNPMAPSARASSPSTITTTTTTSTTSTTMTPPSPPLTLIVAATSRTMGIGLNGHLPWPQLKKEMAYFARITKHPPPPSSPPSSPPTSPHPTLNAVLMGRKTWESIPPRFRPLAGRINVVISRHPESLDLAPRKEEVEWTPPVLAAGSIREALDRLQATYGDAGVGKGGLGRVFVIGGAEIYRAAMGMGEVGRVLLTRVLEGGVGKGFECDTFFPVGLGVEGREDDGADGSGGGNGEWVRRGREAMRDFVGKDGVVPEGVVVEGDVRWEVELWERRGGA